jgi:hypothetical protein
MSQNIVVSYIGVLLSAGHKGAVAAVGVDESVFVSLKYGLRTASQSHLA